MAGKALLMLIAAAALLNVATAAGPLIEHLKKTKDLTTVASVLEQLYPKPIDRKTNLTLFAPTNEVRSSCNGGAGATGPKDNIMPSRSLE